MYNLDIVQFYFLMGNFKVSELSTHFKYKSGILYQPQIKEIFYYGQTRNIWDKLIKREVLIKSENFMQEEFKKERYEVHDDDALFFGIIKSAESFGFLEQIGYFYNINIPDKFLVGFKFFFNKVYVYQNYIKYMNDEFKIVLETLNLYINSPYILNSEKYFLQKFKAKVMDQLRKVIEES